MENTSVTPEQAMEILLHAEQYLFRTARYTSEIFDAVAIVSRAYCAVRDEYYENLYT